MIDPRANTPALNRSRTAAPIRCRPPGRLSGPRGRGLAVWLAGVATLALHPALVANEPFRAERTRVYPTEPPPGGPDRPAPGLHMPTGVALHPSGEVYIVDGANDRIVVCDRRGEVIRTLHQIGEQRLSRPFNARFDDAGRLWIADTGNHRVIVRAEDGSLGRILSVSAAAQRDAGPSGDNAADLTDVLPAGDGSYAWVVDKDAHTIHRIDVARKGGGEDGSTATFSAGGQGEALGRFNYPVSLARASNGDLLVVEAINARIQVIATEAGRRGRAVRTIASLGLTPGHLFRPTGIAVRADGSIWVSDSTLGVIQVFTSGGRFIDVLRDGEGEPLRLQHPMGMSFDANGDLYVVELAANRVQQLRISARAEPEPPMERGPRPELRQPRDCIACHVDWMPEARERLPSSLISLPPDDPDRPYASREEACLSCHDGSVVDSRRSVWRDHGHMTGKMLPPGMRPPSRLPLVDGGIACRTCHTAHSRAGSGHIFRDAVFLRVEQHPVELCTSCHEAYTQGPAAGMHPQGAMKFPSPAELLAKGAWAGPTETQGTTSEGGEMTCLSCHTAHGAASDTLLVMPNAPNRLCLSCHEQTDPFHGGGPEFGHPVSGTLAHGQRAAMSELLATGESAAQLGCITCHKMHHAQPDESLLVESARSNDLCVRCHEEQAPVLGGMHDFGGRAELTNALARSPADTGSCQFCHSTHQGKGPFLWAATTDAPADADDLCLSCHQTGFGGLPASPPFVHPTSGGLASGRGSAATPHGRGFGGALPLFDGLRQAETGAMSCPTCHNVHTGAHSAPSMLRSPAGTVGSGQALPAGGPADTTRALCFECHAEQRTIDASLHHPALLAGLPHADNACGPCHRVHAAPADGSGRALAAEAARDPFDRMWHAPLGSTSDPAGDTHCTGCHQSGGQAPAPYVTEHIRLPMRNPPSSGHDSGATPGAGGLRPRAGGLALFDASGAPAEVGTIRCRTCHNPHGRFQPDELPAAVRSGDDLRSPDAEDSDGLNRLRAMRPMVEPFRPPNACTACHGLEGLLHFLNFHSPSASSAR